MKKARFTNEIDVWRTPILHEGAILAWPLWKEVRRISFSIVTRAVSDWASKCEARESEIELRSPSVFNCIAGARQEKEPRT